MVIFGAGASYDSAASYPPTTGNPQVERFRPPLARGLFEDRADFQNMLRNYAECAPILQYLRQAVQIESVLQEFQVQANGGDGRKARQLAAIRYFLQEMLYWCSKNWNHTTIGSTNYLALLDGIEQVRRGETVCLVTFNYDCLLEYALKDFRIDVKDMPDYIGHDPFRLFKVHGSVNWGRHIDASGIRTAPPNTDVIKEIINKAESLRISDDYVFLEDPMARWVGRQPLFPAIAIPVETKNRFELPSEHLKALKKMIPEVDTILVIGWRGTETHFLELLRDLCPKTIRMRVVTEEKKLSIEVAERISGSLPGIEVQASLSDTGFSRFIVNRELHQFLKA